MDPNRQRYICVTFFHKLLSTSIGLEFLNKNVRELFKAEEIGFYTTLEHCSVVERLLRTLKSKLYRHMYKQKSKRYIEDLGAIVMAYNNAIHSSIGMTPNQVTIDNQHIVRQKLYPRKTATVLKYKYNLGDRVRIAIVRHTFFKGHNQTFTEEVFSIARRLRRDRPMYKLKDSTQHLLLGSYYEDELSRFTGQ